MNDRSLVPVLTFSEFALAVDNRLWLLGVAPEFSLDRGGARWACPPYAVTLQPIDDVRARFSLAVDGTPCHAFEPGAMTACGAETLGRAVAILFGGLRVAGRAAALDAFSRMRLCLNRPEPRSPSRSCAAHGESRVPFVG
jgi:hypothetical protein